MTVCKGPALVVAAHPDDEILGAAIWLHRHAGYKRRVLHITDGSPRDMEDAAAQGFTTRREYAEARRRELREALAMIAISEADCYQFDYADKEAYLYLPELVSRVDSLIQELRPSIVITPAYEGGHPDHDAAHFAVTTLRRLGRGFRHLEFPLYHSGENGEMVTGQFLPANPPLQEEVLELYPAERNLKSRMLSCFRTQAQILDRFNFDLYYERFRENPASDFTRTPHPGALLYERWAWGISGSSWRQKARQAQRYFSLSDEPCPEADDSRGTVSTSSAISSVES